MILVFQVILLRGSAEQIIRIDHNIYKIIRDSFKEFGAQFGKGKCLVRSIVYTTYRRVVRKPLRNEKPTWAIERPSGGSLKPTIMAASDHYSGKTHKVWTMKKLTQLYHWTISLGRSWNSKKPLRLCYFIPKTLACYQENTASCKGRWQTYHW